MRTWYDAIHSSSNRTGDCAVYMVADIPPQIFLSNNRWTKGIDLRWKPMATVTDSLSLLYVPFVKTRLVENSVDTSHFTINDVNFWVLTSPEYKQLWRTTIIKHDNNLQTTTCKCSVFKTQPLQKLTKSQYTRMATCHKRDTVYA